MNVKENHSTKLSLNKLKILPLITGNIDKKATMICNFFTKISCNFFLSHMVTLVGVISYVTSNLKFSVHSQVKGYLAKLKASRAQINQELTCFVMFIIFHFLTS